LRTRSRCQERTLGGSPFSFELLADDSHDWISDLLMDLVATSLALSFENEVLLDNAMSQRRANKFEMIENLTRNLLGILKIIIISTPRSHFGY